MLRARISNHTVAVLATVVATCVALTLIYGMPPRTLPRPAEFLLLQSDFDSVWQRLAHKVLLCTLALFGILNPWLRTRLGHLLGATRTAAANAFAMRSSLLLFIPLLSLWFFRFHQKTGRDQSLLGIGIFSILALLGSRWGNRHGVRVTLCGVLGLYIIAFLLPAFYGSFSFGGGSGLDSASNHYYALFANSPLLALGGSPLENAREFYGLLPQTALAILQKKFGLFHLGDYIFAVQISQVAFVALALVTYSLLLPGKFLEALLCVSLFVPWINTACSSMSMQAPTASAMRYMNFPIAAFALLSTRRLSVFPQSLVLGLMAGFALLANFETGICISLGLCAHAVVSERVSAFKAVCGRIVVLLLGACAAFWCYALLFRLGLGRWPVIQPQAFFEFLALHAGGAGGIPWSFSLFALLLVVYPGYLIVRLTGAWCEAGLSSTMRFKFFISFVLLVWLVYYFSKVHLWNLWPYVFLFTYLIIDQLPHAQRLSLGSGALSSPVRRKAFVMGLLLVFILGPEGVNWGLAEAKKALPTLTEQIALERNPGKMERFSGVWIKASCVRELQAERDYLLQTAHGKRIFFVASKQFLLQTHSGIFFSLPAQDLFLETLSADLLQQHVEALMNYAPDVVLLTLLESDCLGGSPLRIAFCNYLLTQLGPNYKQTGTIGELLIFEKVQP